MSWWIPKTRGQILTGLCALALLATNSFGEFKAQRLVIETVDGVDDLGNPDPTLGFEGPGKSYKNINTGIIVQINQSAVLNQYLQPRKFRNRGLPILDPQTNETLTTTSDLLVVAERPVIIVVSQSDPFRVRKLPKTAARRWQGTQLKVYDPRYPVIPLPTTP